MCMVKLLIIANDAPYGGEKTWNALRLAGASATVEIGMQVRVFLMGDAVDVSRCGNCYAARGLAGDDLIPGVRAQTIRDLAAVTARSDRVVAL